MTPVSFTATALEGIPSVKQGDDLLSLIASALQNTSIELRERDVLVISSKIVSKAEGRLVDLRTVEPSDEARRYSEITGKDPRLVELVLRESVDVSRASRGVLVTEHRLGFVSANAGIDQSNTGADNQHALLLPHDPDATAAMLRDGLQQRYGVAVAIVISDTHGRPFRMGNIGVALGVRGMAALHDLRRERDLYGRELAITIQGYADLVASAAHLICGEGAEGRPVVHLRGVPFVDAEGTARDLNRPREQDLYR